MVATEVLGLRLLTATMERIGRRLLPFVFALKGAGATVLESMFSLVFIATSGLAHSRPIPSVVKRRGL